MIKQIKIYYVLNTRVPTELIPAMCDVFHVLCSGYYAASNNKGVNNCKHLESAEFEHFIQLHFKC